MTLETLANQILDEVTYASEPATHDPVCPLRPEC